MIPCILAILLLIVFYPLLLMVVNSFGINQKGFNPTIENYIKMFGSKGFFKALTNTLLLAFGVTIFAFLIGGSLAFLLKRTDMFFKKLIRRFILISFIIPSYIMAMSWIQMTTQNGILSFLNIEIYSLFAVGLVMTLHLYPMAFLSISNALSKTDVSVEEAARLDGCNNRQLIRYILLPIIRPSVLSIGLFIFAKTVACFGVAALLALPAREYILSTYIYKSMSSLNINLALSISVIMMILTCILYIFQLRISARNSDSDSATENIGVNSRKQLKLGKNRYWIFGTVFLFFLLSIVMPMMTIIQTSLMKTWELPFGIDNITIKNYTNLFFNEDLFLRAIRNSLFFGGLSASIAGIISLLSVFILNRVSGAKLSRHIIAFLCSIPMAIPEMILAVAAVFAWMNPPLKLYNTPWILIVSYITVAIPFLFRNMSGLIKNIPFVYEEMAMTDGASRHGAFWYVTVPQLKKGFKSGWILAFLFIIKEIPISSMLYSSGNETVGVLLFNLRFDTGGIEMLSAISVLIILLTFAGKTVAGVFKPRKKYRFNQSRHVNCLKDQRGCIKRKEKRCKC